MFQAQMLPPVVPSTHDLATLAALMALVADPAAAKARLTEMTTASDQLSALIAEAKAVQASATAAKSESDQAIARARADLGAELAQKQAEHDTKLAAANAVLVDRETAVAKREADVLGANDVVQKMKADLETRLALIRSAAAP
jgi:hypothetical protein